MPDLVAVFQEFALPVAIIIMLMAALGTVAYVLYRELVRRAERAERLVEMLTPAVDELAEAVERQNDITRAILTDRGAR